MILKSLKEKIRNKFNVSLCEIDGLDKWQVATLGLTVITNDRRVLDSSIQGIFSFIDEFTEVQVCEHTIEYL